MTPTTESGGTPKPRGTTLTSALVEVLRSARARIVGWVLFLTAAGMVFAGTAVFLVERTRIAARVDRSLAQELMEFRTLEADGVDPRTGRPFASVERLFVTALERNVADPREAMFGFVDGRVAYFSGGEEAGRLRGEDDFLSGVTGVLSGGQPGYGSVDTPDGEVRFVVLPIGGRTPTDAWVVTHHVGRAQAEFNQVMRTYAQVAAAGLLLVGLVAWFVAGQLLRPVRLVRRTAQQITETDLTRRIHVTGDDDISELARTFNAMLDRLDAAFTTQRQFLDDVGHELRTPITIARGHLELLDDADPADVGETKLVVLDELDRMSRLVTDLTVLAKAERPDFLHVGAVHLGSLVDGVLDKARTLGRRTWTIDARADAVVLADGQRLTQALLQLADNAVKYSRETDTVAVGARIGGDGEVRLWIRDTGTGIRPNDAQRIFQRFQRGHTGGGVEGSGLGLAIVTAIADAHGGRVVLDSSPGDGATFTLVLPLQPADPTRRHPAG